MIQRKSDPVGNEIKYFKEEDVVQCLLLRKEKFEISFNNIELMKIFRSGREKELV
jgi:hypothetical protein